MMTALSACALDLDVNQLSLNSATNPPPDADGGTPGFLPGVDLTLGVPTPTLTNSGTLYTVTYGPHIDPATIHLAASDISFVHTGATWGCSAFVISTVVNIVSFSIFGCSGGGDIAVTIGPGTAKDFSGNSIGGSTQSPSVTWDGHPPTNPSGVTLGTVPNNLTTSPTISYSAAADPLSGVAKYQVKITLTSQFWTVLKDWEDHVSGTTVTGLNLTANTQYSVSVRAVDNAGNTSAGTTAVNFTSTTPPPPTFDCQGTSPSIGSLCHEGTLYAGTFDGRKYMITPGGCTDSATPVCNGGTDTVQKYWNDGSTNYAAVPGTEKISIGGAATKSSSSFRGEVGTAAIVAYHGNVANAAKYCDDMDFGGFTDWHLPSKSELAYLYCKAVNTLNMHQISRPDEEPNCVGYGGKQGLIPGFDSGYYWSSTEVSQLPGTYAWSQLFSMGNQISNTQNTPLHVRCIRHY